MLTSLIHIPVCDNDVYYRDLLENGYYAVSHLDRRLREYPPDKANDAIFHYLALIQPPELQLNSDSEATLEDLQWLLNCGTL